MMKGEKGDVDILSFDTNIRRAFEDRYRTMDQHKERLQDLQKTATGGGAAATGASGSCLSARVRALLNHSIREEQEVLAEMETRQQLNFYLSETAELLERYKKILQTPVKASFTGRPSRHNAEKETIIREYTRIAQKYINKTSANSGSGLASSSSTASSSTASSSTASSSSFSSSTVSSSSRGVFRTECNNCPNRRDFKQEENAFICMQCGAQQEILQHTTSYKDVDRVNISAKYTYDRKVHFRDCINQYQGKQNCTVEPQVYAKLEDAFAKHHLLVGNNNVYTKREVRFGNITKEHIFMFLRELGYAKHYENVILIHSNMTGKKPDDISHLEDRLLSDFDLMVEMYDKHFKTKVDRVNFISTQYVLFQLLQKYKHPCKREDFVILKTTDRKSFHEDITREIFSLLSWSFT